MEDFIFNEKLLNKYHNENERRIAREEGLAEGMAEGMAKGMVQGMAQGMAAQKAEDELLIKEKDIELEQKEAEIARLKAMLEKQNN